MLFLSVRPNLFLVQYAGNLGNCLNATDVRCESIETSMDAQAANFEEEVMDFFLSEPVAFRRVYGLEAYSRTSGESNHHRQSVSDTRVPR